MACLCCCCYWEDAGEGGAGLQAAAAPAMEWTEYGTRLEFAVCDAEAREVFRIFCGKSLVEENLRFLADFYRLVVRQDNLVVGGQWKRGLLQPMSPQGSTGSSSTGSQRPSSVNVGKAVPSPRGRVDSDAERMREDMHALAVHVQFLFYTYVEEDASLQLNLSSATREALGYTIIPNYEPPRLIRERERKQRQAAPAAGNAIDADAEQHGSKQAEDSSQVGSSGHTPSGSGGSGSARQFLLRMSSRIFRMRSPSHSRKSSSAPGGSDHLGSPPPAPASTPRPDIDPMAQLRIASGPADIHGMRQPGEDDRAFQSSIAERDRHSRARSSDPNAALNDDELSMRPKSHRRLRFGRPGSRKQQIQRRRTNAQQLARFASASELRCPEDQPVPLPSLRLVGAFADSVRVAKEEGQDVSTQPRSSGRASQQSPSALGGGEGHTSSRANSDTPLVPTRAPVHKLFQTRRSSQDQPRLSAMPGQNEQHPAPTHPTRPTQPAPPPPPPLPDSGAPPTSAPLQQQHLALLRSPPKSRPPPPPSGTMAALGSPGRPGTTQMAPLRPGRTSSSASSFAIVGPGVPTHASPPPPIGAPPVPPPRIDATSDQSPGADAAAEGNGGNGAGRPFANRHLNTSPEPPKERQLSRSLHDALASASLLSSGPTSPDSSDSAHPATSRTPATAQPTTSEQRSEQAWVSGSLHCGSTSAGTSTGAVHSQQTYSAAADQLTEAGSSHSNRSSARSSVNTHRTSGGTDKSDRSSTPAGCNTRSVGRVLQRGALPATLNSFALASLPSMSKSPFQNSNNTSARSFGRLGVGGGGGGEGSGSWPASGSSRGGGHNHRLGNRSVAENNPLIVTEYAFVDSGDEYVVPESRQQVIKWFEPTVRTVFGLLAYCFSQFEQTPEFEHFEALFQEAERNKTSRYINAHSALKHFGGHLKSSKDRPAFHLASHDASAAGNSPVSARSTQSLPAHQVAQRQHQRDVQKRGHARSFLVPPPSVSVQKCHSLGPGPVSRKNGPALGANSDEDRSTSLNSMSYQSNGSRRERGKGALSPQSHNSLRDTLDCEDLEPRDTNVTHAADQYSVPIERLYQPVLSMSVQSEDEEDLDEGYPDNTDQQRLHYARAGTTGQQQPQQGGFFRRGSRTPTTPVTPVTPLSAASSNPRVQRKRSAAEEMWRTASYGTPTVLKTSPRSGGGSAAAQAALTMRESTDMT